MPINTVAKGNRNVRKTIAWLQGLGCIATKCEYRTKWNTYDLWGADVIARNERRILFVQVKSNPSHIAQGVRELSKDNKWPSSVIRLVVCWRNRAKEPEVRFVGQCE